MFPLLNYIPSGIKVCILRKQESENEELPLLCETGLWARPRESEKDSEGVGERTWSISFGRQQESIRLYYTHICLHTNKYYCACIYKRINVTRMYYILYVVVRRCQKRSLSHEEKKKILIVKRLLEKTIKDGENINVEVNTRGDDAVASCCEQGHKLTRNFVAMSCRTPSSSRLCQAMSSGNWRCVIWLIDSNASKGHAVSIFRKEECPDVGGRRLSARLHGVSSHETAVSDAFRYIGVGASVYLHLARVSVCGV